MWLLRWVLGMEGEREREREVRVSFGRERKDNGIKILLRKKIGVQVLYFKLAT